MKNLHKLALIAAVSLASSGAVASFKGPDPTCKNNGKDRKFSIAVVNTNLRAGCSSRDPNPGEYCLNEGDGGVFGEDPGTLTTCEDDNFGRLYDGTSESYSFAKVPKTVTIRHGVWYSGNKRSNVPKEFYLKYRNGQVETNCNEVLQPDGKCQLGRTSSNDVVLTISSTK